MPIRSWNRSSGIPRASATLGMRSALVSQCNSLSMMSTSPATVSKVPSQSSPVATAMARSIVSQLLPVFGLAITFMVSPSRSSPWMTGLRIFG